jgi:hypothetical protein
MPHRWLFFWRDMTEAVEVERMIARFPRAQAAGFNGVVFPAKLAPAKPRELKAATERYGLALIPVIMGRSMDTHYTEGLPVRDALFVAQDAVLRHEQDNPTVIRNGGFERARGDGFAGWTLFSDAGKRAFVEHKVVHSGRTSVYMVPDSGHCYLSQRVRLQPFRHYRASLWTRTVGLLPSGQGVGITVTGPKSRQQLTFQNTRVRSTENWTEHHVIFNSLDHTEAVISLGSYFPGHSGQLWMDDCTLQETALVNVLRRPGCPVIVRGENGMQYEEDRDFAAIADSRFDVRDPYHEPPVVRLTPGTRIRDGERLRVSYYHPSMIYEFKNSGCLSEPKIYEEWREGVTVLRDLLHPLGYFMDYDEVRVANWCEACRSRGMTPGELLADHLRRSAEVIREVQPGAEMWMWGDMVDPLANAVDGYFLCNGTMRGSWEGVHPDVGIINWYGPLLGANCQFFADRGLRQILSANGGEGDTDGSVIEDWRKRTRHIPGIAGVMCTTWTDNYDALETWAARAFADLPPEETALEVQGPSRSHPEAPLL